MDLYANLNTGRSHHAEHFYPSQNFDISLRFQVICKKLLSDPYVLLLAMAAMFFDKSLIKTQTLSTTSQGTFMPNFIKIDSVVSEELTFEKVYRRQTTDGGRTQSDGISSCGLSAR